MGKTKVWVNNDSYLKRNEHLDFANLFDLPPKDLRANVLTIVKGSKEGLAKAIYVSKSGTPYEGEFDMSDNPYLLLKYLCVYPHKLFKKTEIELLGNALNPLKGGAFDRDDERRVRDTLTYIRKQMSLKNNKQDDPFVSAHGFGLICDVELKA
ncbi:MAG: hypothetical protein Q8O68_01445 [Candidatus Daviesbacteria bacterium]|nr:hypothetical protein [Candidatus Daviesbacteria bacterium]